MAKYNPKYLKNKTDIGIMRELLLTALEERDGICLDAQAERELLADQLVEILAPVTGDGSGTIPVEQASSLRATDLRKMVKLRCGFISRKTIRLLRSILI
tara:strand:+ start:116 stop:415 length:300 start_codon:yes stop_codon:yes gene_type:complete